jgi:hypothetical protein
MFRKRYQAAAMTFAIAAPFFLAYFFQYGFFLWPTAGFEVCVVGVDGAIWIEGGEPVPLMENGRPIPKQRAMIKNARSLRTPQWRPKVSYSRGPHASFRIIIPLWLGCSVAAGFYAFCRFRNQELSNGRLCACGYNLAGNVSGTCPECGAASLPGK